MIGFLIINYNDAATTIKLLNNIKDYSCLSKIVVVDNQSTDHSYEKLKKLEQDKIVILKRTDGRQFGAGINFGLRYLETQNIHYSFVSNSDIIISSEEDLKKIISKKGRGAIIGPIIKEHSGYNKGRKVPTNFQLILSSIPFIYRFFDHKNRYHDEYYHQSFLPVEVVSFCFFFVSIVRLKQVEYLDENVFLYFEENIMSCKLNKKDIYLDCEVEVFHNHSVTINKNLNRAKKYLALSKSRRYFAKNYNHAGSFTQSLLWMIEKLTVVVLSFLSIFYHSSKKE